MSKSISHILHILELKHQFLQAPHIIATRTNLYLQLFQSFVNKVLTEIKQKMLHIAP